MYLMEYDSPAPRVKCQFNICRGYVRNKDGMSKEKRLPACKLVTQSLPNTFPSTTPFSILTHFLAEKKK